MCSRGLGQDDHPIICDLLTTKIAVAAGIFITAGNQQNTGDIAGGGPGQALVNINIKSTPREKFHKTMTPTPRIL